MLPTNGWIHGCFWASLETKNFVAWKIVIRETEAQNHVQAWFWHILSNPFVYLLLDCHVNLCDISVLSVSNYQVGLASFWCRLWTIRWRLRGKIFAVLPSAPEKYDYLASKVILTWAALIWYFSLAKCNSKLFCAAVHVFGCLYYDLL